jgi:hypothetical protein
MKKIYAILVAALFSAGMFAADAPTPTDLANANYDVVNNVVLCVHFVGEAEVCNNVYFVGSHSGWAESFEGCPQFRALQGFDGWYAAQAPYVAGIQGKPIQAKQGGVFAWDYQTGDPNAWTWVAGEKADITAGYDGEANISYGAAGAYIYEVSYWKNHRTPCQAVVTHDYKIILYAPECEENDYTPAVIGDFNNWAEGVTMNADIDGDGEVIYVAQFNDEEGHSFKFRQAGISDWSNQIQIYVAEDDEYKDNPNITLGAETTITLDYRTGKWSACGAAPVDSTVYYTIVRVNVPAGAPAAGVEIIGTFDDWAGTAMELLDNGWYFVKLDVIASDEFKFRETGSWENEIIVVATGEGLPNMKFEDYWFDSSDKGVDCKEIELDLSGEEYVWKANAQGIENVVLTEKAQKVVVDGAIYIIRDNKMFNIHGAQVR